MIERVDFGKDSELLKIYGKILELRQELVLMNLPLVISRARIFYSRTPKSHLSFMDFIQIGVAGLLAGIDKYCGEYSRVWRSVVIGRIVGDYISSYCLDSDTLIDTCDKGSKKIEEFVPGDFVWGVDENGATIKTEVVALHDHGELSGFEIEFDDGYKVISSIKHKFLTKEGQKLLYEIIDRDLEILGKSQRIHKIVRDKDVGWRRMYDLEVSHPGHNFLLPNGVVTSNSTTVMHFSPDDRRRLYRAHKFINRNMETDYTEKDLIETVVDVRPKDPDKPEGPVKLTANGEQIRQLLLATSPVSCDTRPPLDDEIVGEENINRLQAAEDTRPDVRLEEAETQVILKKSLCALGVFDKKILRMKGIEI